MEKNRRAKAGPGCPIPSIRSRWRDRGLPPIRFRFQPSTTPSEASLKAKKRDDRESASPLTATSKMHRVDVFRALRSSPFPSSFRAALRGLRPPCRRISAKTSCRRRTFRRCRSGLTAREEDIPESERAVGGCLPGPSRRWGGGWIRAGPRDLFPSCPGPAMGDLPGGREVSARRLSNSACSSFSGDPLCYNAKQERGEKASDLREIRSWFP